MTARTLPGGLPIPRARSLRSFVAARARWLILVTVVVALAGTACSGTSGGGGGASLGGGYVSSGHSADGEAASGTDGFGKITPPDWSSSSGGADDGTDGLSSTAGDGGSAGSSGSSGSSGASGTGSSGSSKSAGTGTSSASGSTASGSGSTSSGGTAEAITGGDNKVFVLGDSVLLAAETMLPTQLTGWDVTVDAKVSRRIDAGIDVLEKRHREIGAVAVVHLCTNYAKGEGFAAKLDQVMQLLDGVKRVVLVTCVEWSAGQPEANAIIAAAPQKWSNVRVADWAKVAHNSGYAGADGIHLLPPGVVAISKLIADQIGPAPAFAGPELPVPTTPTMPTIPSFDPPSADD